MKHVLMLFAALILLVATYASGQVAHTHSMPRETAAVVSAPESFEASAEPSPADTGATDHSHCQTKEAHAGHSYERAHDRGQRNGHFMVMLGIGTPDAKSVFRTVGAGYEFRLPESGGRVGIGIMGMAMNFGSSTHFMVVGSGTVYTPGGLFFQVESGLTHAHNPGPGAAHQMAILGGLGVGHHCHLAGVAIGPMVTVEYSRVQKPTYSFVVCLGL